MREGLVIFDVTLWENFLPEPEYDDGPFFDEGQTVIWGWDLWQKKEWSIVDDDRR